VALEAARPTAAQAKRTCPGIQAASLQRIEALDYLSAEAFEQRLASR
jgi:hypothetical protein